MSKIDYTSIFGKPAEEIGSILKDLQMFFDKDIFETSSPVPPVPPTPVKPANNEIWYTTYDGQPYDMQAGIDFISDSWGEPYRGPVILSNELVGDHYVITFDGDITTIGSKEDTLGSGDWYLYPMFITDDESDVPIITCNVTSVVLPDTVTYMEYGFYECDELGVVTLPENISYLDYGSFYDCNLLEDLIYQGTKKQWFNIEKNSNWNDMTPITTIHCTDGDIVLGNIVNVMIDDEWLILYDNMSYAEQGYDNLYTQHTYPSGESSEDYRYDTSNYPQEEDNLYTSCIESYISATLTLSNGSTVDIVNKTYIGQAEISSYKDSLVSADILDHVTQIESYAFQNCTMLTSITFADSVTRIENFAFSNCPNLTNFNLPRYVEYVGHDSLPVSSISSITIPETCINMDGSIFYVDEITCLATTPPDFYGGYSSSGDCQVIYVPVELVDVYKAANCWSTYADRIQPIPQP